MTVGAPPADLGRVTDGLIALAIAGALASVLAVAIVLECERRRLHWAMPLTAAPIAGLVAIAVPSVGLVAVLSVLIAAGAGLGRHLQRLERGGPEARRAREAVGLLSIARTRRSRPGALSNRVRGDRLVLGESRARGLVSVPLGVYQGVRGLVSGAPGAGKTGTLVAHASAYVRAGLGAASIDPKGDQYMRGSLEYEAKRRGRDCFVWTPDGPLSYNPLARGTPGEIADKLLAGEQWSEPHYLRQAQRYLNLVLRAMRAAGEWPASLSGVVGYFEPDRLSYLARHSDEQTRKLIDEYVRGLSSRARGELGGVRDRLAVLAESELGPWLESRESELDLAQVLARRDLAYIQLDADRFPLAAQMLGASLVVDLVNLTASLQGQAPSGLVIIDEFAAVAAEQVSRLLSRSRSAGLSVLIACQSFADLSVARPNDMTDSLRRQVLADVDYVVAHRQSEPEAAEILAAMAGTSPGWAVTRRTRSQLGFSIPEDEGTRTPTREFVVHPDEFKRLGVGEAVVIEPNGRPPAQTAKVWLASQDTERPAGARRM